MKKVTTLSYGANLRQRAPGEKCQHRWPQAAAGPTPGKSDPPVSCTWLVESWRSGQSRKNQLASCQPVPLALHSVAAWVPSNASLCISSLHPQCSQHAAFSMIAALVNAASTMIAAAVNNECRSVLNDRCTGERCVPNDRSTDEQ